MSVKAVILYSERNCSSCILKNRAFKSQIFLDFISAAQNLILISTCFDEGIITILYNKYAAERRFFSFKLLTLNHRRRASRAYNDLSVMRLLYTTRELVSLAHNLLFYSLANFMVLHLPLLILPCFSPLMTSLLILFRSSLMLHVTRRLSAGFTIQKKEIVKRISF